ncbi:unnamed protein product, partial [Ectocarpus sp. 4 AP-2014]
VGGTACPRLDHHFDFLSRVLCRDVHDRHRDLATSVPDDGYQGVLEDARRVRYYFGLTLIATAVNLALGVRGTICVGGDMKQQLLPGLHL